jgi:hypothetical protein
MAMNVDGESLDELTAAELVLDELGSRLPSPTTAESIQAVAGGLLGARAAICIAGLSMLWMVLQRSPRRF